MPKAEFEESVDGRRVDFQAAYIFQGGNLYKQSSPYLTLPTWWRRFMFGVLKPRELTVYQYIVSYMGRTPIAYPTYADMKADLNMVNHNEIRAALNGLEDKGFLLIAVRSSLQLRGHARNIYQRPSVAYTLRVLLDKDYIDASLRQKKGRNPRAIAGDRARRNSQCVTVGLRGYLKQEAYRRYASAPPDHRRAVLINELQRIIVTDQIDWDQNIAPTITVENQAAADEELFGSGDEDAFGQEPLNSESIPSSIDDSDPFGETL